MSQPSYSLHSPTEPTAALLLQAVIAVRHLSRTWVEPGWLPIAVAVQCVLLLFRVQYFSRVFRPTRIAFVDSIAEVCAPEALITGSGWAWVCIGTE
jgi:hypothetical protein